MTNLANEGSNDGERRIKIRNWRWWGFMIAAAAVALIAGSLLNTVFGEDKFVHGRLNPQFAIWVSIFSVVMIPATALIYHNIIDEQEERAVLWGMTSGYYTLLTGGLVWYFLSYAGLVAPLGFIFVILGSIAVATAAQLWQQFR